MPCFITANRKIDSTRICLACHIHDYTILSACYIEIGVEVDDFKNRRIAVEKIHGVKTIIGHSIGVFSFVVNQNVGKSKLARSIVKTV